MEDTRLMQENKNVGRGMACDSRLKTSQELARNTRGVDRYILPTIKKNNLSLKSGDMLQSMAGRILIGRGFVRSFFSST